MIDIAFELDHLSEVILPTLNDFSLDDLINDSINESPLRIPEQIRILRSLLEYNKDILSACLDDAGSGKAPLI